MPQHNAMTTPETMHWFITEVGSERRNEGIHWVFRRGDRVKIRIVNDAESDHPMQHPIHFHGQRFFELQWEDHRSLNLLWKDTVLVPTGKTVDILLDCSNPGSWIVHCHIAEHLEAGMMFTFEVRDAEDVEPRRSAQGGVSEPAPTSAGELLPSHRPRPTRRRTDVRRTARR